MYSYVKGVVTIIEPSYIVVEAYGVGYMIYVSNPYSYKQNEEVLVYLYQQIREDENTLYGFKTKDEKDLFLKLISVKGLGPKMALPMLTGDISYLLGAIEDGNVSYLKKFPKIGDKVARQIILDLKGKLAPDASVSKADFTELTETLKALGYKQADIKRILPKIDATKALEEQVKDALKLLLK
ncbi:MAG TPA: Holliday junction branch migration protein RuvA [Candidatus Aphodocola excrementigallinarum]|uniref:Holliday junction branch migration complex subunit RuvA n=1 Tax=Candidatus Aphodocola excrementigallinarum TaxID=2840670 RepID=A0A9D1INR3_9FIRM|nr:Holliday junction branch migration protein RuvA [Candidatus Aphodocola excrementigallinarum]